MPDTSSAFCSFLIHSGTSSASGRRGSPVATSTGDEGNSAPASRPEPGPPPAAAPGRSCWDEPGVSRCDALLKDPG